MFTYGSISGYDTKKLTDKMLAEWRTGKHAANPAQAFLLVEMIDALKSHEFDIIRANKAATELLSIELNNLRNQIKK